MMQKDPFVAFLIVLSVVLSGCLNGGDDSIDEDTNKAPVAQIESVVPNPAYAGQTVTFSASGSDEDGFVADYLWGSSMDGEISTDQQFSTNTLSVGEHTIYLKVIDDEGKWSSKDDLALTILPENHAPVGNISVSEESVHVGEPINFSAENISDPDGDELSYEWDFGDGNTSSDMETRHNYSQPGAYNVFLTVSDGKSFNGTSTFGLVISIAEESMGMISFSLDFLEGGVFQSLELTSSARMSVMVPYLVINPDTGYVQNGTVLGFNAGYDTRAVEILGPPGTVECIFLMAEYGRDDWPVRKTNESWREWIARDGHLQGFDGNIGAVEYAFLDVLRPIRDGSTIEEGALHGTGIIDGLTVFEFMEVFADPDGNYNELWGPFVPFDQNYEPALQFIDGKLSSYGYDAQIHRYLDSSSPYAVNVCGYKQGTLYPDEWLVLGAHLDVAEPGSGPGGGTSVGAHDNKAGVAIVLEAARGLAQFEHRRTIVVCFWSNGENGYDGSMSWIDNIPADVTVTNYLNADSVGTNWPGYYTLVVDSIPNYDDDELGDQWEMIGLLEWIGSNNYDISGALRLGREIFDTEGYASMKDVDSSDQKRQSISVHDSDRGRSDYERFADQLGVVSVDWGSLTGGSDCYHAVCDTLETMIDMMVIDNATGRQSLVQSFDLISWWIFTAAMHLDETPIYDKN